MDQSMMRDLEELQRYASAFGSVLSSASRAAPAGAKGADSTGRVTVDIDAEGRPTGVQVDERWSSDLAAEALGAAVLEAYQDAVSKHLGEWSESLEREGFGYQMRDFKTSAAPVNPFVVPGAPRSGRDLGQLAEELMRLLDTSHARATSPTAGTAAAGHRATGQVSVTLTNGQLAAVHIDARWAQEHSAHAIAAEVMGAVTRAQASAAPDTVVPAGDRRDPLLEDADAVLSDVLHRLTHPTTGA